MTRKRVNWTNVAIGSGLQLFEVTTLGASHRVPVDDFHFRAEPVGRTCANAHGFLAMSMQANR